jgi:hypothetical protein
MKNLRFTRHLKCKIAVTAPGLLLVFLTACGGSGTPASPVRPASTAAIQHNCQKGVYIVPGSATIHINQVQRLSAYQHFPWQGLCYTGPIAAHWSASGGTLKVINSGKQADFSASTTGGYTITAWVVRFGRGTASITVVQ